MCRSEPLPPPALLIYRFRCWVTAWELDSGRVLFDYSCRTTTLHAADITHEHILRLINELYDHPDREYYTQWGIEEL